MNPEALVLLIPISAIIMTGLVKIARIRSAGPQGQGDPGVKQLEARLEAVEQELTGMHPRAERDAGASGFCGAPAGTGAGDQAVGPAMTYRIASVAAVLLTSIQAPSDRPAASSGF